MLVCRVSFGHLRCMAVTNVDQRCSNPEGSAAGESAARLALLGAILNPSHGETGSFARSPTDPKARKYLEASTASTTKDLGAVSAGGAAHAPLSRLATLPHISSSCAAWGRQVPGSHAPERRRTCRMRHRPRLLSHPRPLPIAAVLLSSAAACMALPTGAAADDRRRRGSSLHIWRFLLLACLACYLQHIHAAGRVRVLDCNLY